MTYTNAYAHTHPYTYTYTYTNMNTHTYARPSTGEGPGEEPLPAHAGARGAAGGLRQAESRPGAHDAEGAHARGEEQGRACREGVGAGRTESGRTLELRGGTLSIAKCVCISVCACESLYAYACV